MLVQSSLAEVIRTCVQGAPKEVSKQMQREQTVCDELRDDLCSARTELARDFRAEVAEVADFSDRGARRCLETAAQDAMKMLGQKM